MLLAIDSGNTTIVFAVFGGEELHHQWWCPTDANRTTSDYAAWLMESMSAKGLKPADIDGAVISNVVPAVQDKLADLCRGTFGCAPLVVGESGVDLGMKILVDRPEDVGSDRLVNALAVRERHRLPAIVVDFGTATTFDAVDDAGNFLGGAIAPGVNVALGALRGATAKLPHVEFERPERVIGKGTVPAMQSGIYWGYIGLVESLIARMTAEMGSDVTVVATGGLGTLFLEATPLIGACDPALTLYGLMYAYRRNAKAGDAR